MTSYHRKNSSHRGVLHFSFMSYFTVPQTTVGHCFAGKTFHPMLATVLFILQPEDHRKHRQQVGALSFTERLTNWATIPKNLVTCKFTKNWVTFHKNFSQICLLLKEVTMQLIKTFRDSYSRIYFTTPVI